MSNSIRFLHIRVPLGAGVHHHTDEPALKGGKTIAYRVNEDNTMDYVVAQCGWKENYNRKRGVMIAGGRLLCERKETVRKHFRSIALGDAKPIDVLVAIEGFEEASE